MPATISTTGNVTQINLSGEFDFSSQDELKQVFDKAINAAATEIQLDLVQAVKGLTSEEVEAKYYQLLDRHREELGLAPLRRILRPSLD